MNIGDKLLANALKELNDMAAYDSGTVEYDESEGYVIKKGEKVIFTTKQLEGAFTFIDFRARFGIALDAERKPTQKSRQSKNRYARKISR